MFMTVMCLRLNLRLIFPIYFISIYLDICFFVTQNPQDEENKADIFRGKNKITESNVVVLYVCLLLIYTPCSVFLCV